MKTICSFFTLFLIHTLSFSQNIYFHHSNYTDSAAIAQNIPALATKVITLYKDSDRKKYFNNLYRLQLLAQDYVTSQKNLDTTARLFSTDNARIMSTGFHYRVYCITMLEYNKAGGKLSFGNTYTKAFTNLYRSLPEKAESDVSYYFDSDLAEEKKKLENNIANLKKDGKDSISIASAILLCTDYCRWMVYSHTLKPGKELVVSFDKEKYISDDSVIIPLPDGGSVCATLVRKRATTVPQPAVIMYSIYPDFDHFSARNIAQRGYVGIIVNTRGKRLSKDTIEPFEHDANDAYHIIDWISKQPWCNGKIGMYGGSYLGFAQWSATKRLHPALKTIVPQVSVGAGIDYPLHNGIFMNFMLQWIHFVSNNKMVDNAEFSNKKKWDDLNANWYKSGKSFRALDTLEGRPNKIFQRWLDHPNYDSFWQNMTPQRTEFAKINIPVLTITGYYDDDQVGAMYYYRQHHKWNASANHYLLIGPYDHGGAQGYPKPQLGGYKIDSVANIPIIDIVFSWFDYILKDGRRPAILVDKVNFQVMGKNEWRHVRTLNQINNDTLTFHFSSNKINDRYKLLLSKPTKKDFIEQTVDFKDRKEIIYLDENNAGFSSIIDTLIHPTSSQLIFETEPLLQDMSLNGCITALLSVTINKKDFDVNTRIYEQMPDGKYFGLTENFQRASYANNRTKRELLRPGKNEKININNTFFTSRQLHKGSRLIVLIGVNKSASWQVNYGTGKDVSDENINDATVPLKLKWFNDSVLKVPVWK